VAAGRSVEGENGVKKIQRYAIGGQGDDGYLLLAPGGMTIKIYGEIFNNGLLY
jgi:hypothetical protein